MTNVSLKTIEQNDNVGMFSICFVTIEKNMITDIQSATFEI